MGSRFSFESWACMKQDLAVPAELMKMKSLKFPLPQIILSVGILGSIWKASVGISDVSKSDCIVSGLLVLISLGLCLQSINPQVFI